jgi:hypothetical protein
MRNFVFCSLMLCITLTGIAEANSAKYIPLENIRKLELISVSPELDPNIVLKVDDSYTFHCYSILGRRRMESRTGIKEIVGALNSSLRPHVSNLCLFSPRHGLKVFYKDSEIDYLICYQCGDVEQFHGGDDKNPKVLSIGTSSKGILDRYLIEAKVPLAQ